MGEKRPEDVIDRERRCSRCGDVVMFCSCPIEAPVHSPVVIEDAD